MRVILCRWVGYGNDGQYYARRHDLPFAPFIGLGLMLDPMNDPVRIDDVFINWSGDVVCGFPPAHYGADDLAAAEWPSQLAYHTDGWVAVGDLPCYTTPPDLPEADPSVDRSTSGCVAPAPIAGLDSPAPCDPSPR